MQLFLLNIIKDCLQKQILSMELFCVKYYEGASPGRTIVLRFDKGDYIIEGIRQVLREAEIKNGYIASGIGSFDNCRLKIPLTTE